MYSYRNSDLTLINSSNSHTDNEKIYLSGLSSGDYILKVNGYSDDYTTNKYTLNIDLKSRTEHILNAYELSKQWPGNKPVEPLGDVFYDQFSMRSGHKHLTWVQ